MSINIKLLEEELNEFCQSSLLSENGVRRIIHGVARNNIDNPNNDYKFVLQACRNERITEGIIRCLLEYFPNAVRAIGGEGRLPLHSICLNKNVTIGMVQLLIDAYPESVSHENHKGSMPLHLLCLNKYVEEVGLDIMKLLLEKCPESVKHAAENGNLPIHAAAANQSPEFCRILIEAYPGSERITAINSLLPFHAACALNTVATAKYFYQLYPECINVADNLGRYPIHYASDGIKHRKDKSETAVEMTQFLLDCDSNVASQQFRDNLPLYWVCVWATNNENRSKMNDYLKVLQLLYDAHPETIEREEVTSNVTTFCQEVQSFINTQLTYARQARDQNLINSPDENGQLPLHRALRDNVTLGSIKLLVKGNLSAISCADSTGMIPLHVACQYHYHESANVIEYLISLDPTSLHREDLDDNTALHHVCRTANHAIIALLLDKYGAMYVAKRNSHGQLSIDLLLQNKNEVRDGDEESVQYTESIYRLLRAYPMTLMHYDLRQAGSDDCISQSKKKRKVDEL